MIKAHLLALVAGLLFALGLGIAGMTNPAKVTAFLDVTGAWDPSLMFVMLGAIGVHALFLRAHRGKPPYWAEAYEVPPRTAIDAPLLVGAALFGLGWGASGFCPGPALVAVVARAPSVLVFVLGMLLGMVAVSLFRPTFSPSATPE